MRNLKNSRNNQVQDIISVVKITSLLFSIIGFFTFFFESKLSNKYAITTLASYLVTITMGLLAVAYLFWVFSTSNKIDVRYEYILKIFDSSLFVIFFIAVICVTGSYQSNYKFLFLFIIIASTIEYGMRHGMIVAITASSIILAMDLILVPTITINQYFQNDLVLAGVFILTAWPLGYYVKIEGEHIKRLEDLINEDGLTGVYNHRYFYEAMKEKFAIAEKENEYLAMVFIDLDYFKHYNDLNGHQKGDLVLKTVGGILKESVGEKDIVARYGGEEFAILLPNNSEIQATEVGERIRKSIEKTYFHGEENQPNGKVTVSIGISVYPDKAKSDIDLIKSADDALYRAKFFNKNRVEIYSSILDELKNDIEEEHIDLITSIKTLISVINAKDKYTYGHVERVVAYSRLFAEELCLSEEDKKNLVYGAYMHDIGKINISKEILNKKMPLTKDEWEILKQHSENGIEIIKPVNSLQEIAPLILHHHERYDGMGYPDQMKGDNIPFLVRVLTIVDSFDAMTSHRPYNKRKTYDEAIEELKRCSGTQFDPIMTKKFIETIKKNMHEFQH
ncbi:diguanylate cyclase [Clostridium grantii]|uniref:Diguanylate cyclase (GGDEF) domain-containing protein n=1 Tax=Clostridium grantii DSM 8605 TaxID=1121316 RepID=A0A1M5QL05_9CLOT|nr:diguanylate cyclase [Clostridium grantii]SHH14471.1 diguanylate cyclase (GGDEF) domain-containing protein [Clostridium grantii DSM 8605]